MVRATKKTIRLIGAGSMNRRSRRSAVVFLTLIVIFLILSSGSACAAKIYGVVTDSNGARVTGATVTLYQNGSLYVLAPDNPFSTDSSGYYEFPSLSPGIYSVQADKGGYNSNSETKSMGNSDLEVDLAIPGYSVFTATPTMMTPVYATPTPTSPPATPTPTPKPSSTPVPLPTLPPQPGFELLLALGALGAAAALKRSGSR